MWQVVVMKKKKWCTSQSYLIKTLGKKNFFFRRAFNNIPVFTSTPDNLILTLLLNFNLIPGFYEMVFLASGSGGKNCKWIKQKNLIREVKVQIWIFSPLSNIYSWILSALHLERLMQWFFRIEFSKKMNSYFRKGHQLKSQPYENIIFQVANELGGAETIR